MSPLNWTLGRGRKHLALWGAPLFLGASLLGSLGQVQAQTSTCSSPAGKCVLVSITVAGTDQFAVSVTNDASTQTIGSADITVPSAFTGISASNYGGATVSYSGNVIEVRDLGLAAGAQTTIVVSATPPPACTAQTYTWGFVAKQANNFQGPPGNDFTLDSRSILTTSVPGLTCHLAFLAQPSDAQKGSPISSVAGSTSGPPISVEVQDTNDSLVPVTGIGVALSITPGTGTAWAALGGTVSAATAAGIAKFSYPTIDTSGTDYTLAAEGSGISAGATSDTFSIFDVLTSCSAGTTCTGSDSNSQTEGRGSATTTTVSTSGGGLLEMSLGLPAITCSGYPSVSSTALAQEVNGSGDVTVTLEIGKTLVDESPNNGASFYEICFEDPANSFTDLNGSTVPAGTAGLLPDCSSTTSAPCVDSRTKARAGDVVITFTVPAGDPFYRG